jgi:hypothetical protein
MATRPTVTLFIMWARTGKRPAGLLFLFSAIAPVDVAMVLGSGNLAASSTALAWASRWPLPG